MDDFRDDNDWYDENLNDYWDENTEEHLETDGLGYFEKMLAHDFEAGDFSDPRFERVVEIEKPNVKAREIENVKEVLEQEKMLNDKMDYGEITENEYYTQLEDLRKKTNSLSFRIDLESVGLTMDHIIEVAEEFNYLAYCASVGDLELMDMLDGVDNLIKMEGPDYAQEVADRMLEEKRLPKNVHEVISRKVRIYRFENDE